MPNNEINGNIYAPRTSSLLKTSKSHSNFPILTHDFLICFVSIEMLLFSYSKGTWAIIGFLLPWLWLLAERYREVQKAVLENWILFLLPGLAMCSATWSNEPIWTLRVGTEFALTIFVSVIAGYCVNPKTLVAALLSAFLFSSIISMAFGSRVTIGTTGEVAWVGIFASKNAFAAVISIMMLISVATYFDKAQLTIIRFMAIIGIFSSPLLLYHGRSLGAILAICVTIFCYFGLRWIRHFSPSVRALMFVCIMVASLTIILLITFADFQLATTLSFVGKDTTLTGRTYLWKKALIYISERPILGVGFADFWRIWNPRAQELWYALLVPPGSGLGFHNEYIQYLVELGIIGTCCVTGYLAVLTKRFAKIIMGPMNTQLELAALLFIFFLIRTPVETGLLAQFSIETVLFCIVWIYFRHANDEINAERNSKKTKFLSLNKDGLGPLYDAR